MKKISLIIVILSAMWSQYVFAQQVYNKIDISSHFALHFRFDSHLLEREYIDNAETLEKIDQLFSDDDIINSLDSMCIVASSSPEGVFEHNKRLSRQRAKAVKWYIVWKYPQIDQHSIRISQIDENWAGLRDLVVADPNVPSKERVLAVIDSDVNLGAKKWRLEQIHNGVAWRYIVNNFLRKLRSATCLVLHKSEIAKERQTPILIPIPALELLAVPESKFVSELAVAVSDSSVSETEKKTLLAIKTNLLADVLTCVNIEVEVPIGQRWSISAELMTPWWERSKSDWTMQLQTVNMAVKYWFGDRSKYEVMTGWSLGLYGGIGRYDIQLFDENGSQGDFFNVGLQAGYAHKIGKVLRLEYSLNLGFLRNKYRKYTKVDDTKYGDIKVFEYPWEIRQLDWFGPTNAKISLVWPLNYKTKKRGGEKDETNNY